MQPKQVFEWSVVGAGPAGIAAVGLLIDAGVNPKHIFWVDPHFKVGDFGMLWNEVSSNTSVKLFLEFLNGIHAFDYAERTKPFKIDDMDKIGFTHLREVAYPLQWVTDRLRSKVHSIQDTILRLFIGDSYWNLETENQIYQTDKIILATGATPKRLHYSQLDEIKLSTALHPQELKNVVTSDDTIAVFGSSHSAMIILRNLLEANVKKIVNFYLAPLKFALQMDGWILYDDTGLKGETARWVKENISKRAHPLIERYISNDSNIENYLFQCNKVIYAVGFDQRIPLGANIDFRKYDDSNGIIAPGLFGTGIAFPKKFIDPNGNIELSVGLFKFMRDLRIMIPIWMRYG